MGKILVISSANFEDSAVEQLVFQKAVKVTVNVTPVGSGIVKGGGDYLPGETAIISAESSEPNFFASWNDSNTDNPRNITVGNSDMNFTAEFNIGTELEGVRLEDKILNSYGTVDSFSGAYVRRFDISSYIGKRIKIVAEGMALNSQGNVPDEPSLDNSILTSDNSTVVGGIGTIRGSGPNCRCYLNGKTFGVIPTSAHYLYTNDFYLLQSGATLELTKLRVFVEDL